MKTYIQLLLFSVVLFGCQEPETYSFPYQAIEARNHDHQPLYRIKVPETWQRQDVAADFVVDTTKPICEFLVEDGIRITIHNFPDLRIPPQAQVSRWQKQFTCVESMVMPQAFSGFVGLKFEGDGVIDGEDVVMMGWSLQLAPEFLPFCDEQTCADVTIKIVGPKDAMTEQSHTLEKFARSFELIQPLPTNSFSA